jgi:hypothetical protein
MTFGLVLKRSRREWRQLGVLIVAICLVTAFFALGPLYVRAMIQSGLQYELEAISAARLNLTLISPAPFRAESWGLVSHELGALNGGLTRVARSSSAFPGFQYLYGEVTWEGTPRAGVGFRAYAFSDIRQLLKLVAGRWPDRLPPPNAPERRATTDEQRIEAGLGIYSRGDVEAVVTRDVIQGQRRG